MSGRRATAEEKASALSMYAENVFITEIAKRTGFGTTTIYRWACEAGIVRPFSERLASGATTRQFGREVIGKKGVFHTAKGGVWIHTDSTYEMARLEQLEALPRVARIDRCRDRIKYEFCGKLKTYIPDFTIELQDGTVIVEEVKPNRWVSDSKVRAKVLAAEAYYANTGVIFRVVSEEDIGRENLQSALKNYHEGRSPEYVASLAERQRIRHNELQRGFTKRWQSSATPEQKAAKRAYGAMKMREHRAAKKAKNNA
jgi:hypothetical protein